MGGESLTTKKENFMSDEIEQVAANETEVATSVEQVTGEGLQEAIQTPVQQERTETQAFSDRLKESTTKAEDAVYSKLFGSEHGIHTKAAYDAAMAAQQEEADNAQFQEVNGFDPNSVKPLFEEWKKSDPDFQELSSIRQEKNIASALSELNTELKDCGIDLNIKDFSDAEIAKLPNVDKVMSLVSNGKTFAEAVFLANKKEFYAKTKQTEQQDTLRKIADNKASSPGNLSGGGENSQTFFTKEEVDKMSQEDVRKNLTNIHKSTSKW